MNDAEQRISDLKDGIRNGISKSGQQTKKPRKKQESNVRALWDKVKQANVHMIGIPEEKGKKGVWKII